MNTKDQVKLAAYQQGREAAINGWERISPYKQHFAEDSWYAGFDSV